MSELFLEFFPNPEKNNILKITYNNSSNTTALILSSSGSNNNRYGFIQEGRINVNEIINGTVFQENWKNRILAGGPLFYSDFNLGQFNYIIITKNTTFDITVNIYLLQYIFLIQYSFCEKPKYYVTTQSCIPITIDNSTQYYSMNLIYVHEVVLNIAPIHYCWKLEKILVDTSKSLFLPNISFFIKLYNQLLPIMNQYFDNTFMKRGDIMPTNDLTTKKLVPEALWFNFWKNYEYNFGENYGLVSSFLTNNSFNNSTNEDQMK